MYITYARVDPFSVKFEIHILERESTSVHEILCLRCFLLVHKGGRHKTGEYSGRARLLR